MERRARTPSLRTPRRDRSIIIAVALALTCAAPRATAAADLTEGARLSAIYELILAARFAEARRGIATACPPAPAEACLVLDVASRWWEIILDPSDRRRDEAFLRASDTAVAAAERWTVRDPQNAESWFYLAGAYGPRVQWRALRGERMTAAREGARVKRALERALALDTGLQDAYFGLGLYQYYADVVPAAARLLQWLLFLPGGDRELGLKQMHQARERGQLLAGEADFQLHLIYLWYEQQPQVALSLLESLDRRYPSNPVFLQRVAAIQCEYVHNHEASANSWRRLLARSVATHDETQAIAISRARLGLAHELYELERTHEAITELQALIAAAPSVPFGILARAHLALGRAYDRAVDRSAADRAYAAALQHVPAGDPDRIRDAVRDAQRRRAARAPR
jgi:tetratricopeptide (TPR) repeat protein